MKTVIITSDQCDAHQTGEHIEAVERRPAIMTHLTAAGLLTGRALLDAPLASDEHLARVHSRRYINLIGEACRAGGGWLDHDTHLSPGSDGAARAAAGAALLAVERVLASDRRAFAITRPPGHHALPERGMGFCIYNGIAVATAHALEHYGLKRVLIVDWDVHHGNGTQAVFIDEPRVCFFSIHQWPHYPGTGAVDEMGSGAGWGTTVNVPVPARTGDGGYGRVLREVLLPVARRYTPDLILVSAGFDAHRDDPLSGTRVTTDGFAAMARLVCTLADGVCGGRIAFVLEGGYNLEALAQSVAATLRVSDGQTEEERAEPAPTGDERLVDAIIARACELHQLA